jgi:hypothetical protein
MLASASPKPVQGSAPAPTPRSRDRSVPPGAGKREHHSLRVEAGRARPERLRGLVAITVLIYSFAKRRAIAAQRNQAEDVLHDGKSTQ